jgi:hypothetical protein
VPDGESKIVIDRYHVAHLLVDGVDRVRRHEHAQLRSRGDERLKGTRYMWIKGPMKRGADDELRIAELSRSGLRVGRAWALKEAASDLWAYRSRAWALKYFKRWYYWATHSQLPPMIRVAKTMKRYLPWILDYLRSRRTQRSGRGDQLQDPGGQVPRSWLSQPRELPPRYPLPLWRPRSLPTLNPEARQRIAAARVCRGGFGFKAVQAR